MTKVMTRTAYKKTNMKVLKHDYIRYCEMMKHNGKKPITFEKYLENQYKSYVIQEKEINQPDAYLESEYEDRHEFYEF